jgi:hypothetical protein
MLGCKKGFVAYVLKVNPNVKIVHCMIHQEALVTNALPEKLNQTMNEVIKVVNYIKSNSLPTRIFFIVMWGYGFRSQSEMALKRKSSWTSDIFGGRNRFIFHFFYGWSTPSLTTKKVEAFIDLKNDLVHKTSFSELKLSTFWIFLLSQYPELSRNYSSVVTFSVVLSLWTWIFIIDWNEIQET